MKRREQYSPTAEDLQAEYTALRAIGLELCDEHSVYLLFQGEDTAAVEADAATWEADGVDRADLLLVDGGLSNFDEDYRDSLDLVLFVQHNCYFAAELLINAAQADGHGAVWTGEPDSPVILYLNVDYENETRQVH